MHKHISACTELSHSYVSIRALTMLYGYVKAWLNFPQGIGVLCEDQLHEPARRAKK